ncbi:Protein of unknown function [Pyronema omphalodes CBS 100304]|uniref:Uncharacterized protein n=1 Tax=Pyronema omphalodes (strain CBS 100304) TaxID=1076935 RepID=U4L655_PYROM|nr:Protein of unknown function [Pyronema omphalodes CBS 100304]
MELLSEKPSFAESAPSCHRLGQLQASLRS